MADDDKKTKVEFPPIDPTKNVMDLVDARSKHLEDLICDLAKRLDDADNYIKRELELRIDQANKLSEQESRRLDAIRTIDGKDICSANDRLSKVETWVNEMRGRQGLSSPLVAAIGAIVGGIIVLILNLVYRGMVSYGITP